MIPNAKARWDGKGSTGLKNKLFRPLAVCVTLGTLSKVIMAVPMSDSDRPGPLRHFAYQQAANPAVINVGKELSDSKGLAFWAARLAGPLHQHMAMSACGVCIVFLTVGARAGRGNRPCRGPHF